MSEFLRVLKSLPMNAAPAHHSYRLTGGRLGCFTGRVLKAHDGKVHSSAVLTYPEVDYDGDFVNPEGGDWTPFFRNPVVNFDHGVPVGIGRVEMASINGHNVPIGHTRFFESAADCSGLTLEGRDPDTGARRLYTASECLPVARQIRRMVADDVLRGVSLEFRPAGPEGDAFWETGSRSALLNRPAYHYERWHGLTWTHAERPKNPSAQTLSEVSEKAFKLIRDRRYAGEEVHPVILKSFARFAPTGRTIVRVEKAMPQQDAIPGMTGMDDTDLAGVPVDDPTQETDDTPPTAKAAYDLVQQAKQLLEAAKQQVAKSEHKKGKERFLKCIESIEAELEDLSAVGDMIHSDVNGSPMGDEEPETHDEPDADDMGGEGDGDADDEMDDEEREEKAFRRLVKPLVWDKDGLLVTKSGYVPRGLRFSKSDLKPPIPRVEDDPDDVAAAERELAESNRLLKGETKKLRTLVR